MTEPTAAVDLERFSGFADLYDAHRPSPPAGLGALLCAYAGTSRPLVVDLGSGTGLSSRWAASWAGAVIGVEPNPDMRTQALARLHEGSTISYLDGTSTATGLAPASADVVLAVQALHWMDPQPTHDEVARVLRPGGVFAAVDADWPPVSGNAAAESAWAAVHARIRVLEARLAAGVQGAALRAPIASDDPALVDESLRDPHRNRAMPGGVRSWSKDDHLARMQSSQRYAFVREALFDEPTDGGADRFVALLHSQGSYQVLRRRGLTDADIGADVFAHDVHAAFAAAPVQRGLSFSWRARIGIRGS